MLMTKVILHIHGPYSTDGWHNPINVSKFARENNVVIEHLQHNKLTLPRLCPEFFRSEYGISAIELGLTDTDVVAAGDNLSELARDKRFPIFNNKVKRMLDVSLEEGIEILRRIGAEYIYLPHPTFIAGAAKNGYKNLLSKVDAIEVFNATTSWFPPYNKRALLL